MKMSGHNLEFQLRVLCKDTTKEINVKIDGSAYTYPIIRSEENLKNALRLEIAESLRKDPDASFRRNLKAINDSHDSHESASKDPSTCSRAEIMGRLCSNWGV